MPQPQDDYATATTAAEAVIKSEIQQYVPAVFQGRIPPAAIDKFSAEVGKAVVDALAKAHAVKP